MKGVFGSPKQQRYSMQFGYDIRPSFWQEIKANSHLVIAAIGTAALLGIAGTALWLAMPAGDRQAFADPEPQAQAEAKVEPQVKAAAASVAPVASGKAAPKADAVKPQAMDEVDIAALPLNDPRWTGEEQSAAAEAVSNAIKPTGEADAELDKKIASVRPASDADADLDAKAATAAIPTARPQPPVEDGAATEQGRILRAVTMRSGPKKRAAAIGTIPAKAAVQVVACKSWCEIIYKGKRGFIYKSFLKRGG